MRNRCACGTPTPRALAVHLRVSPGTLGDGSGSARFYAETSTVYDAFGYQLIGSIVIGSQEILWHLGSVVPPSGPCLIMWRPAQFYEESPVLGYGVYDLKVDWESGVDTYTLTIAADGVTVRPINTTFSVSE